MTSPAPLTLSDRIASLERLAAEGPKLDAQLMDAEDDLKRARSALDRLTEELHASQRAAEQLEALRQVCDRVLDPQAPEISTDPNEPLSESVRRATELFSTLRHVIETASEPPTSAPETATAPVEPPLEPGPDVTTPEPTDEPASSSAPVPDLARLLQLLAERPWSTRLDVQKALGWSTHQTRKMLTQAREEGRTDEDGEFPILYALKGTPLPESEEDDAFPQADTAEPTLTEKDPATSQEDQPEPAPAPAEQEVIPADPTPPPAPKPAASLRERNRKDAQQTQAPKPEWTPPPLRRKELDRSSALKTGILNALKEQGRPMSLTLLRSRVMPNPTLDDLKANLEELQQDHLVQEEGGKWTTA